MDVFFKFWDFWSSFTDSLLLLISFDPVAVSNFCDITLPLLVLAHCALNSNVLSWDVFQRLRDHISDHKLAVAQLTTLASLHHRIMLWLVSSFKLGLKGTCLFHTCLAVTNAAELTMWIFKIAHFQPLGTTGIATSLVIDTLGCGPS